MERHNEEMEIDLLGLFYYLKKKIVIIVAVCLIFTVAGFLGTKLFITPTYSTNTRMYVLNVSGDDNVGTSDFQIANYFLSDYKVLITGQNVTKEVVKRLNLDVTPDALAKKIEVTSPANTRILQIAISDADPQKAADIANCVREVASQLIERIMSADAVQLVYEAEVPANPSGPNTMRNTAIAGALGLIVAVGIYAVIFILDDTIRTEEDVERYLGLGTMGVIPMSGDLESISGNRNVGKTAGKTVGRSSGRSAVRKPAPKKAAVNKQPDDSKK